jgi:hypothetical protein
MSQISSVILGATPGEGPVLTLTADNAVAVSPTGGGTIFVTGSPNNLITTIGNNGTHTITVALDNTVTLTATTNNNVPTNVAGSSIPLVLDDATFINISMICSDNTSTAVRSASGFVCAVRNGGGPSLGNPVINYTDNGQAGFFPTVGFTLVGNNVVTVITGIAATTIDWRINLSWFYLV